MQPPIIVLGEGTTLLGAIRNTARQGIETYASTPPSDFVAASRYYRSAVSKSGRQLGSEWDSSAYDALAELPYERAVLLPCSDQTADWIANMPGELRDRFPSSNPAKSTLDVIQNKREFALLCRQLEIPHPKCFLPGEGTSILAGLTDDSRNWFLKPFNSRRFMKLYSKKAVRVQNRTEAEGYLERFAKDNVDVILQEYVSGSADQHYFIDGFRDRDGIIRGLMARRRTRIYPLDFGDSSYCHQVPLSDVQSAWESLERILIATNYHGIFSGEFKYDETADAFKILEINARVWVYVEFAAWCGIDVCKLAYLDALGCAMSTMRPIRKGAGCVHWVNDLQSVRKSDPAMRPKMTLLMGQWFRARKTLFCWDDPLPFAVWTWRRLFGHRP